MKFYNLEQIHVSEPAVCAGSHSALLCEFKTGSSMNAKITNHRQFHEYKTYWVRGATDVRFVRALWPGLFLQYVRDAAGIAVNLWDSLNIQ